jgi:hypothetical protein
MGYEEPMKQFLILFLLLVSKIVLSAEYLNVIKNDGSIVSGELIGKYEDKWFWEFEAKNHYLALYQNEKIFVVNQSDIQSVSKEDSLISKYQEFLLSNKLYLSGAPLRGWNYVSTGNEDHHLHESMYGNFAWDIIKVKAGLAFKNFGQHNEDYFVWNQELFSPISGTIVDKNDLEEDNLADPYFLTDLSQKTYGNYVLLKLHNGFYFVFLHLKQNSIPKDLKVGSKVEVGQLIGTVGNSGISYLPHLHMTLYYYSEELKRMISVPTIMKHIEYKNNSVKKSVPSKGDQFR